MESFEEYREELRQYLIDPHHGMLLLAKDYIPAKSTSDQQAFFQLTSGTFAEKFVTIWEIFDDRMAFSRCMSMLAAKANAIRESSFYSTVVTCTTTAKEIGAHIQDEVSKDNEVAFKHFGDYPSSEPANGPDIGDLYREHVLILTDVVASGSLVKKLAEIIEGSGGKVVAVLAIVVTAAKHVDHTQKKGWASITLNAPMRVYSLTDYEIAYHTDKPGGDVLTIKIDPVTVLPQEQLRSPSDYGPLIKPDIAFTHFLKSNCLEYGLYQLDEIKQTASVDFSRLLDVCGDDIWARVSQELKEPQAIVTSYKKDDIAFSNFIYDRLGTSVDAGPPVLVTVKRDTRDTPYFPFNLRNNADVLRGKNVLLAMSAVTTSVEMSNIVALLASFSAKTITVFCLLNRMGVYSLDFVKRIDHLLNGNLSVSEKPNGSADRTVFQYTPVYYLPCFQSQDLDRMHHNIVSILTEHASKTRVPNFRRLARQNISYLSPATGPHGSARLRKIFQETDEDRDFSKLPWGHGPNLFADVPLRRNVERICALSSHAALTRNYDALIEEIGHANNRYTLYFILQLIIADVEFLRFTGKLDHIKSKLEDRLYILREQRFSAERQLWEEDQEFQDGSENEDYNEDDESDDTEIEALLDMLNDSFELEIHTLFCLAVLTHFDAPHKYQPKYFDEIIFSSRHVSEWSKFPLNLRTQFGDERFIYAVSLLLFGVYPGFSEAITGQLDRANASPFEQGLGKVRKHLLERLLALEKLSEHETKTGDESDLSTSEAVQATLTLLVTELGTHDATELHQVIRYLHKQIAREPSRHNQIIKVLTRAKNALQDLPLEAEMDGYRSYSLESLPTEDIVSHLNRALEQATLLQTVAEYTIRLYRQTPSVMEKEIRYINASNRPGMARDVSVLEETLLRVRNGRKVSHQDFCEIRDVVKRLKYDFYGDEDDNSGDDSHLRKTLFNYIMPLRNMVSDCINEVSGLLKKEGLPNVWESARLEFLQSTPNDELLVLCDRYHLKEIVSNLLLNVRHSGTQVRSPLEIMVKKEHAPEASGAQVDYIELWIATGKDELAADILLDRNNTVAGQRLQIQQYGGSLQISNDTGRAFYVLRFVSRADYLKAYREYQQLNEHRYATRMNAAGDLSGADR